MFNLAESTEPDHTTHSKIEVNAALSVLNSFSNVNPTDNTNSLKIGKPKKNTSKKIPRPFLLSLTSERAVVQVLRNEQDYRSEVVISNDKTRNRKKHLSTLNMRSID